MKKYSYLFVALLLIASTLSAQNKTPHTLTVAGTAEVSVKPDICYMSFTVLTQGVKSAGVAYRTNNDTAAAVQAAVKSAGIEAKDIQTTQFSVAPAYHYDDKARRRIFDGYTVLHTLSVNVRDLDKVSKVLDAAVGSGVTEVSSITFTVENPKKYTADARLEAIKAAQTKAEIIAGATGVKLLKPMYITEDEPGNYANYYAQANESMDALTRTASGEATLEPGQTKLTHTVHITYEIE